MSNCSLGIVPNNAAIYVGSRLSRQRECLERIQNFMNVCSVDNKMRLKWHLNREAQYGSISRGGLLHESVFRKPVFRPSPLMSCRMGFLFCPGWC